MIVSNALDKGIQIIGVRRTRRCHLIFCLIQIFETLFHREYRHVVFRLIESLSAEFVTRTTEPWEPSMSEVVLTIDGLNSLFIDRLSRIRHRFSIPYVNQKNVVLPWFGPNFFGIEKPNYSKT